jgi:hypothetical protein
MQSTGKTCRLTGGAFLRDINNINNLYPVLTWQNSSEYADPRNESLEGLAVSLVSAENGLVSVKLDRQVIFSTLAQNDFTATISIDEGAPQPLEWTGISQVGSKVTLTFASLEQDTSNHSVNIAVGYQDGAQQSGSFINSASSDWLLYAQQPAVGDGTAESPYRIGTAEELAWFSALVNGELSDGTSQNSSAWAVLTADISLNDSSDWQNWDKDSA